MKYLIVLLTMFPMIALAEDCNTQESAELHTGKLEINTDVPRHLEGATITVRLKDGTESTVPAEKFKVVRRQQQFIVNKTVQTRVTMCKNANKNRVSVLAGHGPKSGLSRTQDSDDQVTIENRTGTVLGAEYQRDLGVKVLNLPIHGGVQYQNNETLSGALGVSW